MFPATRSMVELQERLSSFASNQTRATLVLHGHARYLCHPLASLQQLEALSEELMLISHLEPFVHAQQWVENLILRVRGTFQVVNGLRHAQGLELWPKLPLRCLDAHVDPQARLLALLEHCIEAVTFESPVVWGFFPSECEDPRAFAELMAPLLELQPWMDHHRYVIWETDTEVKDSLRARVHAGEGPASDSYEVDLSPDRLAQECAQVAMQPGLDDEARSDLLMELAAYDMAHDRHDMAREKLNFLLTREPGQCPNRPILLLNMLGELATMQGNHEFALEQHRRGIAFGMKTQSWSPAAMYGALQGAGQACVEIADPHEALGYFDLARKAAQKSLNVQALAQTLVSKGKVQAHLGHLERDEARLRAACETFESCETLSVSHQAQCSWEPSLSALVDLYETLGESELAQRARERLEGGYEQALRIFTSEDGSGTEESMS